MNSKYESFKKQSITPVLDGNFKPAAIENRRFIQYVLKSGKEVSLAIIIKRGGGLVSTYKTIVFNDNAGVDKFNYFYVERLIKTLLWLRGGWKIIIGGSKKIGEYIKKAYTPGGLREFDAKFMSSIYEKPFTVETRKTDEVPSAIEKSISSGGNLNGCRIGFDLGASDRKVSAVIDGRAVFSEEVVWNPGKQADPCYHYHEIMSMLHHAAAHMPRVDAIGGSSAGIYINNRVMSASIFRGVSSDIFKSKVKNIFLDIQSKWNVPLKVINDGEVTALAGSISLKKNAVLGIAMGSSEAGGYINERGNINDWLNELAFVPIDLNSEAPVDEWSGDQGCGVQYLSQVAAIRLAKKAGIVFDGDQTPADKLKSIQKLMAGGDKRARKVFETIGCYLGYSVAYYAQFYEIKVVLILGRVTSGEGGQIIIQKANQVLEEEFPELASKITLHLPDESSRRVGQSIAAASLPLIGN